VPYRAVSMSIKFQNVGSPDLTPCRERGYGTVTIRLAGVVLMHSTCGNVGTDPQSYSVLWPMSERGYGTATIRLAGVVLMHSTCGNVGTDPQP
jgi:hypothetical protein